MEADRANTQGQWTWEPLTESARPLTPIAGIRSSSLCARAPEVMRLKEQGQRNRGISRTCPAPV